MRLRWVLCWGQRRGAQTKEASNLPEMRVSSPVGYQTLSVYSRQVLRTLHYFPSKHMVLYTAPPHLHDFSCKVVCAYFNLVPLSRDMSNGSIISSLSECFEREKCTSYIRQYYEKQKSSFRVCSGPLSSSLRCLPRGEFYVFFVGVCVLFVGLFVGN